MPNVLCATLLPFAVVGACLTFAWLTSQLTARPFPWRLIKILDKILIASALFGIALVGGKVLATLTAKTPVQPELQWTVAVFAVIGICWLCLRASLARHYVNQMHADSQIRLSTASADERLQWSAIARCWRNQISELEVNQKQLVIPELPEGLDGCSITHLSDLHVQVGMPQEFFHRIADQVAELASDLTVISGDFVDSCRLPAWFEAELGRIAPTGHVTYVLGNHDKLALAALEQAFESLDWAHCAAEPFVCEVGGVAVRLFGDQTPWLSTNLNERVPSDSFDIAVCHSPDAWSRAIEQGFPLTLAGHTHGGQIRLPGLGPVLAPSRFGTYYACGVFEKGGQLMHVSRGVYGSYPLRFRCRPEITQLVLKTG